MFSAWRIRGYYRLPDGSRGAVIESYFSDRITGETKKYSFVVTFKDSFWTDNSPYLGELDPNSISGPTSVTVPQSRYRPLNRLMAPITAESDSELDSAIAAPFQESSQSASPSDMAMLTDFSSADDSLINSQGLLSARDRQRFRSG